MAELLSEWWVWASAALALATLEVILGGSIWLWMAVGGLAIALLLLLGLAWLESPILLSIFGVLSAASYWMIRRKFGQQRRRRNSWEEGLDD